MKKLLVVVGPTGAGKTRLSISLAKQFNGELVSADSRQVYRQMDIGTGKEVEELQKGKAFRDKGHWVVEGVKIHLYDILDPDQTFSVAQFQQKAYDMIHTLQNQDKLPILVGGTGLYVSAVVDGLKVPKAPPDLKLRSELQDMSLEDLQNMLLKYDPGSAKKIDTANPRRIIRALEVFAQTGRSFVSLQKKYRPDFDILQIGLSSPRELLYDRVDRQVEKWFELGFVEEVKKLLEQGYQKDLPSMTGIGYRQIVALTQGVLSESEAKQRIKFDRHSYIRRQLSWFKRDGRIRWFDITRSDYPENLVSEVSAWYTLNDEI